MPMCVNWKITHMDSDDLAWMKTYEIGDVEFFLSNKGNIDILLVRGKDTWNKFKIFRDNEGSNEYIAGGCFNYIVYHKSDTIDGYFSINKAFQSEPVLLSFSLADRFCSDSFDDTGIFGIPQNLQSVKICGIEFHDCLIADDKNSDWGKYQIEYGVTSFVWSKSKGLLQYSFLGGEVFTRIEFTDFGKEIGLKRN